ncbi:MAG: alpha/beta hydrolase [Gammaproteobacteria bacterium]|nr:alpha/beta hydrolase [Gammaproteobacteria bacterium]MBU2138542.1 alpha/beta hydrolase [Gammaproteobacteria bacterium]MBU2321979.1 alpha/beta hydrolase [Gammaproteobacteria bacterium]
MRPLTYVAAKLLRAFARRMQASFTYDPAVYPLRSREERWLPTATGSVRCLFYWPQVEPGVRLPVYLNLHGGGFVAGIPEHDDSYCQRMAHNLQCLVVNPDYALAPEHPFPEGLNQCFAVLEWLASQAPKLGIDPWCMAVGGQSAGGNLATGVARLARDHAHLRVLHQVLLYAAFDLQQAPELKRSVIAKPLLRPGLMGFFNRCYLPDPTQAGAALASPACSSIEELRGLPPATVISAEYDLLQAESEVYGSRLRLAGVAVNAQVFEGCDHMFTHLGPEPAAEAAWQQIEDDLRQAFAVGPGTTA